MFFPNYRFMNQSLDQWKTSDIYNNIYKIKPVFVETQGTSDFNSTIGLFKQSIDLYHKGILFSICRGKASEGLDFSDNHARAVIIIGKMILIFKQEYLTLTQRIHMFC